MKQKRGIAKIIVFAVAFMVLSVNSAIFAMASQPSLSLSVEPRTTAELSNQDSVYFDITIARLPHANSLGQNGVGWTELDFDIRFDNTRFSAIPVTGNSLAVSDTSTWLDINGFAVPSPVIIHNLNIANSPAGTMRISLSVMGQVPVMAESVVVTVRLQAQQDGISPSDALFSILPAPGGSAGFCPEEGPGGSLGIIELMLSFPPSQFPGDGGNQPQPPVNGGDSDEGDENENDEGENNEDENNEDENNEDENEEDNNDVSEGANQAVDTTPLLGNEESTGTHEAFIQGDDNGEIRPDDNLRRSEVATILFRRLADSQRIVHWRQENAFSDVNSNHWFNNAVSTMANAGIFTGMPDGTFQPQREITRAEFAVTMVRAFSIAPSQGANVFPDVSGHWAAAEINALAARGWISGRPNGNFAPNENITRAEAVVLITRMLGRNFSSETTLLPGMQVWPDNMDTNAWYYLYIQDATNSNTYVKDANGNVIWTGLLPARDWSVLERPNSTPHQIIG